MKEKSIEDYLVDEVKARGGRILKINPENAKGFPDRMALLPGAVIFFEVKRPVGGVVSEHQKNWGYELTVMDIAHCFVKNKGEVDIVLAAYDEQVAEDEA